jgi:hypothetical protein
MTKPTASLSLDLDNKWAYLRTHGAKDWEKYPSYLSLVAPRILDCCAEHDIRLTCFVVGRDAQRRENHDPLASLAEAGHEVGNHSLNHYPWMHTLAPAEVEAEICAAEEYIEMATGRLPIGFRGPGYSLSETAIEVLAERGYEYDATTLPTYIGPLARWYFRRTASTAAAEQAQKRQLLGSWSDGMRPNKEYFWTTESGPLVEIPVTTFPIIKMPIHMTYLLCLWQFSPRLAKLYVKMALRTCRWLGVGPSLLLHPLDFLDANDDSDLRFFPGMNVPRQEKRTLIDEMLSRLMRDFQVGPIREHAAAARERLGLAPALARRNSTPDRPIL